MTFFEALILGLIQGLTEFLPVSSSGHLEIGSVVFGIESSENLLFALVVHLATALATIVVFRKDIFNLLADLVKFQWNESSQFAAKILISMIPVFIVGVFFKDYIESFFTGNMLLVGSALLITSCLLLLADRVKKQRNEVSYSNAVLIGIAQAVAVLPGISRSGATISTALLLGVDKEKAARFSFLMVLVPILGASLLELKEYLETGVPTEVGYTLLGVGFLAAFLSGVAACLWMIKIVKKGKLTYFAAYCFLIGVVAIFSVFI